MVGNFLARLIESPDGYCSMMEGGEGGAFRALNASEIFQLHFIKFKSDLIEFI
jgi:hypothetical protein